MLGKTIELQIDRPVEVPAGKKSLGCSLSRGTVRTAQEQRKQGKPAYAMGYEEGAKRLTGTVIAILNKGSAKGESYVVAPEGSAFYEPQIRRAINMAEGTPPKKINCLYEKSCGAVVFREKDGQVEFLLVKNKNGRHWGFPKGHVEDGETEEETALREIKEETGLSVAILPGFRETSEYRPYGKIKKQVVFFAARAQNEEVTIQQAEIDRFQWADFSQAMQRFRYENDQRVLKSAAAWLKQGTKGPDTTDKGDAMQ